MAHLTNAKLIATWRIGNCFSTFSTPTLTRFLGPFFASPICSTSVLYCDSVHLLRDIYLGLWSLPLALGGCGEQ